MTKVYTKYDEAFNILAEALEGIEVAPALLSHQQVNSLKMLISDAINMMEQSNKEPTLAIDDEDQEALTEFEAMGGEFWRTA